MQVAETFTAEFSAAMLEAEDQIADADEDSKKILAEMYVCLTPYLVFSIARLFVDLLCPTNAAQSWEAFTP